MSSVWEKRWGTLETLLTALAKQYKKAAQNDPWMEMMCSLVASLCVFGDTQFDFFYKGFFKNKNLCSSLYYPKEHVMHATLDQIVYDMSLFQQAAGQRQKKHLRPTLEKADKLAQLAINVAIENNLLKETGVITYFDKSPNIRLIPYAPIALISIPYTCIDVAQDLLAIPHEVGHYVYRHSPGLISQLHEQIDLHPMVLNWLEEIFCDVYGTLVAGPVIGLDFEDLLLTASYSEFITDDGNHPVPAIRPYTYITTLKQLHFTQAADALEQKWERKLRKRHNPTTFFPYEDENKLSLNVAKEVVQTTSKQLLAFLLKDKKVVNHHYWSQDTLILEGLYSLFAQWIEVLPQVDTYLLQEEQNKVGLMLNGTDILLNERKTGSTQTWRDWFKRTVQQEVSLLNATAWLPIFSTGGWTTQGPDDDGDDGL